MHIFKQTPGPPVADVSAEYSLKTVSTDRTETDGSAHQFICTVCADSGLDSVKLAGRDRLSRVEPTHCSVDFHGLTSHHHRDRISPTNTNRELRSVSGVRLVQVCTQYDSHIYHLLS